MIYETPDMELIETEELFCLLSPVTEPTEEENYGPLI